MTTLVWTQIIMAALISGFVTGYVTHKITRYITTRKVKKQYQYPKAVR